MIKLPFLFYFKPEIEAYSEYVVAYKGLDLSFLTSKTNNYINNWNMPDLNIIPENREIQITYKVPDLDTARQLVNDYSTMHSENTDTESIWLKDGSGYMLVKFISASWEEWSNDIRVIVSLLGESGFRTLESYDLTNLGGNQVIHPQGIVDFSMHLNFHGGVSSPSGYVTVVITKEYEEYKYRACKLLFANEIANSGIYFESDVNIMGSWFFQQLTEKKIIIQNAENLKFKPDEYNYKVEIQPTEVASLLLPGSDFTIKNRRFTL